MDNHLPIYVFNVDDERNIDRIVSGERVGTVVKGHPEEVLRNQDVGPTPRGGD
jgi:hypothetical protein